jgi:hypothetical protein
MRCAAFFLAEGRTADLLGVNEVLYRLRSLPSFICLTALVKAVAPGGLNPPDAS